MAVKLIAADMDGTLLDSNKNLSPHIFDLVKKLKEKDVKFAIASGRQYFNLINNFQEIKDELIYIMKRDKKASQNTINFIVPCDKKQVKEVKLKPFDVVKMFD